MASRRNREGRGRRFWRRAENVGDAFDFFDFVGMFFRVLTWPFRMIFKIFDIFS